MEVFIECTNKIILEEGNKLYLNSKKCPQLESVKQKMNKIKYGKKYLCFYAAYIVECDFVPFPTQRQSGMQKDEGTLKSVTVAQCGEKNHNS